MEEKEDILFRYNDTDYRLLVSESKSKSIKLEMENIKDHTIETITKSDLRGNTPDCVVIENEKLANALLDAKILEYCNTPFVKIDVNELSKYNHKGVEEFIKNNAKIVEYRTDIGNTEEEIRENIKKDAKEVFKIKEAKRYFKEKGIDMRSDACYMYSILNTYNIKESYSVFFCGETDYMAIVFPYMKELDMRMDIIMDFQYSDNEYFYNKLDKNCQIIQINKCYYDWFLGDLEKYYPNFEYKKGVEKFLKYCIKHKVDKDERIQKEYPKISKLLQQERTKLKRKER